MAHRKDTDGAPVDEYDEIDPDIEAGTIEYWKARARQWQKRSLRAEREKTELIAELAALKRPIQPKAPQPGHAAERRAAVLSGDLYPGTGQPPRAH
ncbi:hypothetical protein ACKI1J_43080 [Streptomyces scabiei]|uniref:hypothetical protein n=1 Tax=Streptomyces TaxID=1883 RepID=UPI0029AEE9A2|nr:hypothetical protein [Streptomyces stelliscabiei]MDX2552602.1 hypothetical protein [Streptomyces stelliscabiei]